MGKNQGHRALQASRHGSRGDGEQADLNTGDGVDVSFHSSAWHEARIAALTVERPRWALCGRDDCPEVLLTLWLTCLVRAAQL